MLFLKTLLTTCLDHGHHSEDTHAQVYGSEQWFPSSGRIQGVVRISCNAEVMNRWGVELYGDPCRECAFAWHSGTDELVQRVAHFSEEMDRLLANASGTERVDHLEWNISAYVSHVADNLRIWAERIVSTVRGANSHVHSYDENVLAQARRYNDIALSGALWSLQQSCRMWLEAVTESRNKNISLHHPVRGILELDDVIRANVHDAVHHRWDVEAIVRS